MEIRVKTGALEASFELEEDATFDDTMEAITGALIAEGYHNDTIRDGYFKWAKKFGINQNE